MEIICPQCGKTSDQSTTHVNRAKKSGLRLFCGRQCANLAQSSGHDADIAELYARPDGTMALISKKLGVSEETVRHALIRMGIPRKPRSFRTPRPAPTWDEFFSGRMMPVPECGCILWMDTWDHAGYGLMQSKWTPEVRAHRASWFFAKGPIPDGLNVLHRCDVRCCINPDHLFLGTQRDNVRDMFEKGREGNHRGVIRGELSPQAVLTDEMVIEIRRKIAAGECSQNHLAKTLGVSPMTISRAMRGETWSHING